MTSAEPAVEHTSSQDRMRIYGIAHAAFGVNGRRWVLAVLRLDAAALGGISLTFQRFYCLYCSSRSLISRRKCQFDPAMAMARGAGARKMPVGARFGGKCHLVPALAVPRLP